MTTQTHSLSDVTIHPPFKLSALWISTMFCYIYGDFFSLFVPGKIQHLMDGKSGVGDTTPLALLAFAVLMTIPSLMIVLSLLLKPRLNRLLNVGTGVLFTLIMAFIFVQSVSKEWMIFYSYFAAVEIILTTAVVRVAWKWV